jgi:hypothetical protein
VKRKTNSRGSYNRWKIFGKAIFVQGQLAKILVKQVVSDGMGRKKKRGEEGRSKCDTHSRT